MTKNPKIQSGAVSLFVVIFSALLITVVSIGFLRIMVRDQAQATNTDLSQSAYDSALSGVEDGKRAILKYYKECVSPGGTCTAAILKSVSTDPAIQTCMTALQGLGDLTITSDEVKLQTSLNDADLDQAYTCVKIYLNTSDYLGNIGKDATKLIPLKPEPGQVIDSIKLDWFSAKDVLTGSTIVIPSFLSGTPLLADSVWGNRPSVMRAQLIQFSSSGLSLASLDNNLGGKTDSSTLFLYPTSIGVASFSFPSGNRRVPVIPITDASYLKKAACVSDFSNGGYSCSAQISLPDPINGDKNSRVAYLNLSALYNGANFRVTLLHSGSVIKFDGIQPEIDSTGRANSLFRRVKSRVEMVDSNYPYPKAAVDLLGNLCKTFMVSDSTFMPGSCTP